MKEMKPGRISCAALVGLAALLIGGPLPAGEPAPAAPDGYETFKLINERNIFNQSRYKDGVAAQPPSRTPRVEHFALVGTILGGARGDSAFFEGSSEAFSKQVKISQTIAGYTLQSIHPNFVTLEAEGEIIELPLGTKLQRQDGGAWKPEEYTPVASDVPPRLQLLSRYANSNRNNRGTGGQGFGGFGGGFGNPFQNGFNPFAAAAAAAAAMGMGQGEDPAANEAEFNTRDRFDDASNRNNRATRNNARSLRGGDDFGGGAGAVSRAPTSSTLTTTPSTGASEADILERLRRQREQEQQR